MKTLTSVCLLLGLFIQPQRVFGQVAGSNIYLSVGYNPVGVGPLNTWFGDALKYPKLQGGMLTGGLGVQGISNNWVIGVDLDAGLSPLAANSAAKLRAYRGAATLKLGYVVLQRNGLILYPLVGAGYGAFATRIWDSDKRYPTFVPAPKDANENVVLSQQGLIGQVGLGLDLYPGINSRGNRAGFILGLRAGYSFMPTSENWKANYDASVTSGALRFGAGGPFVKLILGGGVLRRR